MSGWVSGFPLYFLLLPLLPFKGKDIRFIKTIFFIPLFVFRQIGCFVENDKAKRSFIKTPHTKTCYIDDLVR